MIYIYPYKKGSNTVQALRNGFENSRILRLDGSQFKGGKHKNMINWGNSSPNIEVEACTLLNKPKAIGFASNKYNFFKTIQGTQELTKINIPEFTKSREEAYKWLQGNNRICVREKLTGHSAEGLHILHNEEEWDDYDHSRCSLYVKYIPKESEYRVHVFNGKVIDIQRKSVPRGNNPLTWEIRSHANGFMFTRGNAKKVPEDIEHQCIEALKQLGLDFGAVDVIYNNYRKTSYLLEVNTAPGLTGTTLTKYLTAFGEFFNEPISYAPEEEMSVEEPPTPFEENLHQNLVVNWVNEASNGSGGSGNQ